MSFDSLVKAAGRDSDPATGVRFAKLEEYYDGKVRLDAIGVSLPPKVRVLEMVAPFPRLSIDVLSEVLSPEGFILGDDADTPALLRRWWQANNLDTVSRLAIVEALVQGDAYWVVGRGTDKIPRITAHPRRGVAVSYDHMGGVAEAVMRYTAGGLRTAVHFEPGLNTYYVQRKDGAEWQPYEEIETGVSRPTIVPMRNLDRLGDLCGRSEIHGTVRQVADAASRTLTQLQLSQELLASPPRYVFGEKVDAGMYNRLKHYIGGVITIGGKGSESTQIGQLSGADLSQFSNSYKLYAQIISSITGVPPSMLGISTDNPASAEAMRVAKDRLITRAEAKSSMFGDDLEDVARIALEMYDQLPEDHDLLELRWRDPATPSESARTAALLQAQAQGVIGAETAREGLRLTPQQLARENAQSASMARSLGQLGG